MYIIITALLTGDVVPDVDSRLRMRTELTPEVMTNPDG